MLVTLISTGVLFGWSCNHLMFYSFLPCLSRKLGQGWLKTDYYIAVASDRYQNSNLILLSSMCSSCCLPVCLRSMSIINLERVYWGTGNLAVCLWPLIHEESSNLSVVQMIWSWRSWSLFSPHLRQNRVSVGFPGWLLQNSRCSTQTEGTLLFRNPQETAFQRQTLGCVCLDENCNSQLFLLPTNLFISTRDTIWPKKKLRNF